MRTTLSVPVCLFLCLTSACGEVVLRIDAGAAPDAAQATPDAGPDAAADAAPGAVDAAVPDAVRPDAPEGCVHEADLRRTPAETFAAGEPLPIFGGSVRAAVGSGLSDPGTLFVGPLGTGILGGNIGDDFVERQERLVIAWDAPVESVSLTLSGGIDGDGSGFVGFNYQLDGGVTAVFTGDGTDTLDFPGPVSRIDLTGATTDGVRLRSVGYTICP
jgi:hypothetical protein